MIEQGLVLVNGLPVSPGTDVTEADEVRVSGRTLRLSDLESKRLRILMLNKPVGVVTSTVSTHGEMNVVDYLKQKGIPEAGTSGAQKTLSDQATEDQAERFFPVGRLDKDSEGLLLLTNQGDWVNDALRSRNRHEKEYEVTLDRDVTTEFVSAMERGVYLEELDVTTRPCTCVKTGKNTFRIVISQGYNRQIRRMSETVGGKVIRLKRIRFMNLTLGELVNGEVRELTEEEIRQLMKTLGRV